MAERTSLRWPVALVAAGMLLIGAAAAAWRLLPAQYEAFALLQIRRAPPVVLGQDRADAREFDVFKRTQAELLTSSAVLNGTLRDPHIASLPIVERHAGDPLAWLKGQVTISFPNQAEIMRVGMRGSHPEELRELVDKVVEVYLQEIVHRDKQLRMEHEQQLQRAYERQNADYQKQLAALDNLQKIHATSGSEAANVKRQLASETLTALLAQRAAIADEIRQTSVEIELEKARDNLDKEVRTGQATPTRVVAAADPQALPLLLLKQEILEAQLSEIDSKINEQTKILQSMANFSEQVATKAEEVEALRSIKNKLKAELDVAAVERLAEDRVLPIDKAVLVHNRGDAQLRAVAFAATAACGVGMVAVGLALFLAGPRAS